MASKRGKLTLRNLQSDRRIDMRLLRRIARLVADDRFGKNGYELTICLLSASEMARLNAEFLAHDGPTDVITFDYWPSLDGLVHGEVLLCVAEALRQARQFGTTWPQELARYLIHGLLHLDGHDDQDAAKRRRMKREENRVLREISRQFPLRDLAQADARASH